MKKQYDGEGNELDPPVKWTDRVLRDSNSEPIIALPNYREIERLLFTSQILFANFLNFTLTSNVPDKLKQELSDLVSDVQTTLVKELEKTYNEEKQNAAKVSDKIKPII